MSAEECERLSVLTERIENLIERLDRIEKITNVFFVTRAEFWPVQKLVYGGIGVVLCLVVAELVKMVVRHG